MTTAYPVYHAFGGITFADTEESRARWQGLVDRRLAALFAMLDRHKRPAPPKSPAVLSFMRTNLFQHQDSTR